MPPKKIKVLALVEAEVVTSPAKILLNFGADCRDSVDLTLVTFSRKQPGDATIAAKSSFTVAAEQFGIPVRFVTESSRFDLSIFKQLAHLIDELQPDIVQTNAVKSHFIVSLLRKRTFQWIAFHHGYTSEDLKMRLYNQLGKFSLKRCNSVVTVCEPFAQQLQQQGIKRDRISVVPNGIAIGFLEQNAELVREWRTRVNIEPDERVLVSIGRLSPEKGHRYLIEAISAVVQSAKGLKLKLLIAGTGILEVRLAEMIKSAGLEKNIKLIGFCQDVKPLFMIADLFVLSSLSEGSPMVLLESMAARVPIVTTGVGGIPDLTADGQCAVLVPPGDVSSLSDAILALLLDRERAGRLANLAFERVRDRFNPAIYNDRILTIFRRTLASAH